MKENVERFVKRMKEDPAFAQIIASQSTKDRIVEIACAQGFDLAAEDIDTVNATLRQEIIDRVDQTKAAGRLLTLMLEDSDFAAEILPETEAENIVKKATEAGIVITEEEADSLKGTINALFGLSSPPGYGELSEDDLEQVAGGTMLTSTEISISIVGTIVSLVSAVSAASAATYFSYTLVDQITKKK